MKRDMDLVRRIMFKVEEADGPVSVDDVHAMCSNRERAVFHIELLAAHGLIRTSMRRVSGPEKASGTIDGLTWEGFDYLDAIRSDAVWSRSKEAIAETVGEASLSVVKEVCSAVASAMVKSALGL